MIKYYSAERNVQILIALLKEHGIRKIVASPGATNVAFVASVQSDSYFQIYSSVDERSAAYIACGLAEESGEPVIISCTGATASRNYLPGLTEAYYRKLPVLAITSTQLVSKVGHLVAQVIDRSNIQNDIAKLSVALPYVNNEEDVWECETKVNKAILELNRHGGGPVHIDLPTMYNRIYDVKELPKVNKVKRYLPEDVLPSLPEGNVAIFIGAHKQFNESETTAIEKFCETNNGVVFCDHTSSYKGKYRVNIALAASQRKMELTSICPDILIHIGEVTGDYYTIKLVGKYVWRVNRDGELRDFFRRLNNVFEMPEKVFFEHYGKIGKSKKNTFYDVCIDVISKVKNNIPELPFSNIWMASQIADKIPAGSNVHFGILNSLRSWNFFDLPESTTSNCNVGGFGIDGCVSSLLGASLANKEKLYFGIVGDLAFFYDMNVIGNRSVQNNMRLMVVNNGKGTEFKLFDHTAAHFEHLADQFIAAEGHFGKQSSDLLKNYSENLGFEYMSASNKDEFINNYPKFLTEKKLNKPILFEIFTDSEDESNALEIMLNLEIDMKSKAKDIAKQVLGKKGFDTLKSIIKK